MVTAPTLYSEYILNGLCLGDNANEIRDLSVTLQRRPVSPFSFCKWEKSICHLAGTNQMGLIKGLTGALSILNA